MILAQFVLVHCYERVFFLVRIEEFYYTAADKILPVYPSVVH